MREAHKEEVRQGEHVSYAEAERDAKAHRDKWAAKGFVVTTELVTIGFNKKTREATWGYRSDVVGGLPPGGVYRKGEIVHKDS